VNSGFDANLTGWTLTPSAYGAMPTLDTSTNAAISDSDACPFSHSVTMTTNQSPDISATISQCAPVSAGQNYDYGAALSNGDMASGTELCNEVYCALAWYSGPNCTLNDLTPAGQNPITWEDFMWEELTEGDSATAPPQAVSAKVYCFTDVPYSSSGACIAHFDKIFLELSPGIY
jgi:hypothetical protein